MRSGARYCGKTVFTGTPCPCPDCYTLEDFADDHPQGIFVVGTGNHVVTVEDGVLFDSWDSRSEYPVYYWSTEKEAT